MGTLPLAQRYGRKSRSSSRLLLTTCGGLNPGAQVPGFFFSLIGVVGISRRQIKTRVFSRSVCINWKLIQPDRDAAIDEIHFSGDNIDAAARKKRMPNEITYMNELGMDLQHWPAIWVPLALQVFECPTNESHAQMHTVTPRAGIVRAPTCRRD